MIFSGCSFLAATRPTRVEASVFLMSQFGDSHALRGRRTVWFPNEAGIELSGADV